MPGAWCSTRRTPTGGINGRKIKYIVEDNQYQIPRSIQAANKLINRDGVFMMVANGGTPMNNATMPDQLAKGVPNVFPLTSARSMYEPLNHLKFGLASSYYDQMRAGVKVFVEQHGKKTVCAMSQDTDFGRDVMDGARDELKATEHQAGGGDAAQADGHRLQCLGRTAARRQLRSDPGRRHRARYGADHLRGAEDRLEGGHARTGGELRRGRGRRCRAA